MTSRKPVNSLKPPVTLLTNQAYVLMYLAEKPVTTLSAIARKLRITERAIQRIMNQLAAQGYVTRSREGRRIQYKVHLDKIIRHPMVGELSVGALLNLARPTNGRDGREVSAMVHEEIASQANAAS
jgi:DNA-binding transcriptional ArsR family regulator